MTPDETGCDEWKDQYEAVKKEKQQGDTDAILQAIKENELNQTWEALQKQKSDIKTDESFKKYKKDLTSFFNKVRDIITSPGVEHFINWIDELDNKHQMEKNKKEWLQKYLQDHYAEHNHAIKTILDSIRILESNEDALFKATKNSINTIIAKTLSNFEKIEAEFKPELPGFINDLEEMFHEISEIQELNFSDVKDFYTDNIDEKSDNDFEPKLNPKADYHFELIKKMVDEKDRLTSDKTKIRISTIGEKVTDNIDDIFKSIDNLKSMDICNTSENRLNESIEEKFYDKFEKNFEFTSNEIISDTIQKSINDLWEPLLINYSTIDNFFKAHSIERVDKLEKEILNWKKHPELNIVQKRLNQYIKKIKLALKTNPIGTFQKLNSIGEISKVFSEKSEIITDIDDSTVKDNIKSFFDNIIGQYKTEKIKILKKWDVDKSVIKILQEELQAMKNILENIKDADTDTLLETLINDLPGLRISYETIFENFKKHSKDSGMDNDAMAYLDKIYGKGKNLDLNEFLDDNTNKIIKNLLEHALINITISKNV